ncbi:Cytochrome P450 2L1 [Chionoecetes opilio]|uniref:Cytochrome P450 2L1 n=1 Tax=Chionoecetes opilio TaxID=41210 RepID=A0A8J4XUZ7_CHIOP|nr:Cytochrome P450 2L1 [Chionoecetes opilio]
MDDPRVLDFIQLLMAMTREFEGSVTLFNFLPWLGKIAPVWLQQQLGLVTLQKTTEKLANFAEESVKQHEDTLDPLHRRDLIDQYLMSIKEDQDPLFKREELLMLVIDLFFAGAETTSSTILWTILYLAKYPGVQERVQQEIDDVLPKGITPQYQDRTKRGAADACDRLFFAGAETTSSTILWTILYLAVPGVQERLQQEIDDVLPKGITRSTKTEQLPYFEAMLSEVQRVVSLVPLGVPHMATQDTEFEGYTIPKVKCLKN